SCASAHPELTRWGAAEAPPKVGQSAQVATRSRAQVRFRYRPGCRGADRSAAAGNPRRRGAAERSGAERGGGGAERRGANVERCVVSARRAVERNTERKRAKRSWATRSARRAVERNTDQRRAER